MNLPVQALSWTEVIAWFDGNENKINANVDAGVAATPETNLGVPVQLSDSVSCGSEAGHVRVV